MAWPSPLPQTPGKWIEINFYLRHEEQRLLPDEWRGLWRTLLYWIPFRSWTFARRWWIASDGEKSKLRKLIQPRASYSFAFCQSIRQIRSRLILSIELFNPFCFFLFLSLLGPIRCFSFPSLSSRSFSSIFLEIEETFFPLSSKQREPATMKMQIRNFEHYRDARCNWVWNKLFASRRSALLRGGGEKILTRYWSMFHVREETRIHTLVKIAWIFRIILDILRDASISLCWKLIRYKLKQIDIEQFNQFTK